MKVDGKERIWPTNTNLDLYLMDYPEHEQRYKLACSYIKNMSCADVACGAGYGSFMLGKFAKDVTGYDISLEALRHANSYFKSNNVLFEQISDFRDKQYEAIISFETLEHMNEKEGDSFLTNISDNLCPEGLLILSTPLNNSKYRENVTEFHIREYNNPELREKLQRAGFYIEKWYGQSNLVSERISKEFLGLSFNKILNTGLHRLFPKVFRNFISEKVLGKNKSSSVHSIKIEADNLEGSFSQIAVCRKQR